MIYLLFLLAAYGMAFGIQNKVPFLHGKVKVLDALLQCPYCLGFWTGWVTWGLSWVVLGSSPILAPPASDSPLHVPQMIVAGFVWALASTVFCYLMDVTIAWLETNIKQPPKEGSE